jgi:hypothetical protein
MNQFGFSHTPSLRQYGEYCNLKGRKAILDFTYVPTLFLKVKILANRAFVE